MTKLLLILLGLAVLYYVLTFSAKLIVSGFPQLKPYFNYVDLAIRASIVGVGGYFIISIIRRVLNVYLLGKIESSIAHTISLFLDIILYSVLILAILASLGVNLTGAAIGGAIGGIAIGLAAQTVLSNVLSGTLVTASKTLKPGDNVSLISGIWGNPIIGEVQRVGILFTDVKTTYGNIVRIPNSAFLGNTVFSKLEGENSLIYILQVTISGDVPVEKVLEKTNNYIKDYFGKTNIPFPEIYFTSKSGGTNVFTVIVHFNEMENLNKILDTINKAFDKAYWDAKMEKS